MIDKDKIIILALAWLCVCLVARCDAALYGQTCNSSNTCTENGVVCKIVSNDADGTCACINSYYRSAVDKCEPKLSLNTGTCTLYNGNTEEACSATNAYCSATGQRCQCKSTFYRSDVDTCSAKADLGGACTSYIGNTAGDPCKAGNVECVESRCKCVTGQYQSGSDTCSLKLKLGVLGCLVYPGNLPGDPCSARNAYCPGSNRMCECMSGYYKSGEDECSIIVGSSLGESCNSSSQTPCSAPNAVCKDGNCQCNQNFYRNESNACSQKLSLSSTGTCTLYSSNLEEACSGTNVYCPSTGQRCQCKPNFYRSDVDACSAKLSLSSTGTCTLHSNNTEEACSGTNVYCPSTGQRCQCKPNFYRSNEDACSAKLSLSSSGTCTLYSSNLEEACSGTNVYCPSTGQRCQCKPNFYRSDVDACSATVGLGTNCTATFTVNPATPCSTSNAECLGSQTKTCQCKTGYYQSGSDACSSPVVLGAACTAAYNNYAATPCSTPNAECIGPRSKTCQCKAGYYKSGTNKCSSPVGLGTTCTAASTGNLTTPCSTTNAECFGSPTKTCQCKTGYYQSGSDACSSPVGLGTTCTAASSGNLTIPCSTTNAECLGSQTKTCQCKTGYYQSGSDACSSPVVLGAACTAAYNNNAATPCSTPNAECIVPRSKTCQCKAGYYKSGTNKCSSQVDLDGSCTMYSGNTAGAPCTAAHAECYGIPKQCQCKWGFYRTGSNTCSEKLSLNTGTCTLHNSNTDEACSAANAYCQATGQRCQCKSTFYISGVNACSAKLDLATGSCSLHSGAQAPCTAANAECSGSNGQNGQCQCIGGYYRNDTNRCSQKLQLGVAGCTVYLTGNEAAACSVSNAACSGTGGRCQCNDNYYQYDKNTCNPTSDLRVSVSISQVTTTSMMVSWVVPEGKGTFINSFKVEWVELSTIKLLYTDTDGRSANLSGLTPGRAYSITVTSINTVTAVNSIRSSNATVQQATKPDPPTINNQMQDFDVSQDNTIVLTWNAPAVGRAISYHVSLRNFSSQQQTVTDPRASITNMDFKNGATYIVVIVALSEFVSGKPSEVSVPLEWTIKTDVKVPSAPANVTCSSRLESSITLTWTKPNFPNGDLLRFIITAIASGLEKNFTTSDAQLTYTVDGLSPGTFYNFKVFTVNEQFTSTSFAEPSTGGDACKTKANMSGNPEDLQIVDVTSRRIQLSWKRPINIYSEELLGYVLRLRAGQDQCVQHLYYCSDCTASFATAIKNELLCQNSVSVNQTKASLNQPQSVNVTGLMPDTLYTITVEAVNDAGLGRSANRSQITSEEEPQEPPTNITVTGIQKKSFVVSWDLVGPRPGKVTYNVTLTPDAEAPSMTYIVEGFSNKSTVADKLEEYVNYKVTVSAKTNVGNTKISVATPPYRTLSAAPGQVTNFKVIFASQRNDNYTALTVQWSPPKPLEWNSYIVNYVLKHNVTESFETKSYSNVEPIYKQIFSIKPETTYYFEVYAENNETSDKNGAVSTIIEKTPAGIPKNVLNETSNPVVKPLNLEQTTIQLNIAEDFLSDTTNGAIRRTALLGCQKDKCEFGDYRTTKIWKVEDIDQLDNWKVASTKGYSLWRISKDEKLKVQATSGRRRRTSDSTLSFTVGNEDCAGKDKEYCNGPLAASTQYIFVVVVCTSGGCLLSQDYGPYSTKAVPPDEPNIGMIVGIVVGCAAALIIIIIVIIILRRRRSKKPTTHFSGGDIDILEEKVVKNRPIRLSEFNSYLAMMKKDSNLKFSSEYEDLKTLSPKFSTDASDMEENRPKNRYINIIPFDSTRVKLSTDGNDDSDYINANFLPGYNSPREYIGCQGPLAATVDDMWRMIWEQNVSIIVMLTLCTEGNKNKCEQYWPDTVNEPKQYGEVVVEVTSRSTINHYDLRMMKISNGKQKRELKHFHFLTWHDYKADVHHNVMLNFISRVRESMRPPDSNKPTLVHCSAGVGRTGTYIAVDHLMQFIRDHDYEEQIDIFDLVLKLRHNRSHMVQTEQQYIFIHECVKEMLDEKMKAHDNLYANVGGDDNLYANTQQESLYENTFTGKTREEKTEL